MIIAHNKDSKAFQQLLKSSVNVLEKDAADRQDYYLERGGIFLEKDIFSIFQDTAAGTIFENQIELVSGQKFPDIVAYINQNKAFGVEVKTTKQKKWRSTGSSIFEGTRVPNVENIYLLFGKLIDPVEFRCKRYEDCLYDVAITHSPRYLIDMEISPDATIFSKVGMEYDELRQLSNPFDPIKKYLRKNLKPGSDIWWVDSDEEQARNLEVKSWANLETEERNQLKAAGFALFPKLFSSSPNKYHRLATYLVSQHGVVCHSLRDAFSAGGRVYINGVRCPKIFQHVQTNLPEIKAVLAEAASDDLAYYWFDEERPISDVPDKFECRFIQWEFDCLGYLLRNSKISDIQRDVFRSILRK